MPHLGRRQIAVKIKKMTGEGRPEEVISFLMMKISRIFKKEKKFGTFYRDWLF